MKRDVEILDASTCSEEQVRSLEQTLGRSLPSAYRHFLLKQGTGIAGPKNRFIRAGVVPQLRSSILVERFLSPQESVHTAQVYNARIPYSLLPIAENSFGDLICLDYLDRQPGVFYWDHEREDAAYDLVAVIPHESEQSLTKIAESFGAFLTLLQPMPN